MPLWIYWALFFAVIGVSLLAAAWVDARVAAAAPPAFERPDPRAVEAIEVPKPVDPFATTIEIDRSQALGARAEREDDGPAPQQ